MFRILEPILTLVGPGATEQYSFVVKYYEKLLKTLRFWVKLGNANSNSSCVAKTLESEALCASQGPSLLFLRFLHNCSENKF